MPKSLFDLTGKVALVTGGNGGIGLGIARGLANAGASIVVAGRNAAKSKDAVAEIEKLGAKAFAHEIDVTDNAAVEKMIDVTTAKFGRLDILINNAGTNIRKPADVLTLDEWHFIMGVNLTSTFTCSKAAYPALKKSGGGKIVNIGSMMSIFGASFTPAYAASKGGVVQFTKATAISWAPDNIQVNAILPGWIDTALTVKARADIEGLNERVLQRTPAKRWGHIDDMAGVAVFLSSSASDFVTGTAIPVDGGYSVQG